MSTLQKRAGPARIFLRVLGVGIVALGFYLVFLTPPYQRFVFYFNITTRQVAPAVVAIMDRDPDLHARMLGETWAAYNKGGWPAASVRFHELRYQLIQVYAGDSPTRTCGAAVMAAMRSLDGDRAGCSAFMMAGGEGSDSAMRAVASTAPACDAALEDGERRRLAGEKPATMTDAEYGAAFLRSFDAPVPLSPEERRDFLGSAANGTPSCGVMAKLLENGIAQPPAEAARYLRSGLGGQYPSISFSSVLPAHDVPAELHCAPSGTIFTLSMETSGDGKPITWESQGQDGWDCRLKSSASGERGLWGDERTNALRLLWPLQVGKSVSLAGPLENGVGTTTRLRVAGVDNYWLPFGHYQAYAIDEAVMQGDRVQYAITYYWSPALGFKIGQRTVVYAGGWPAGIAPDWQLIAMQKP